jgi:hypothetical protein
VFARDGRQPGDWGYFGGQGMNGNSMCAFRQKAGTRQSEGRLRPMIARKRVSYTGPPIGSRRHEEKCQQLQGLRLKPARFATVR